MAGRSRLSDIARTCSVSTATVSRILNRDSHFHVRPEVRKLVHDTAKRMGYVPDLSARNLNKRDTRIAGVFSSPYTHIGSGVNESILEGVSQVLHASDYDVFYEVSPKSRDDSALPFWRFDGAILLQSPLPAAVEELDRRQVPYVCVNENVGTPAAAILADDAQGMRLAIEHLHELGHHTIAYANANPTYFPHYSIGQRHETLVKCAKERGIALMPGHDKPFGAPAQFIRNATQHHVTALITYDHRIAVALMGAAQSLGIRIPADLSLVSFNDEFPLAELYPGVTTIAVAGTTMGQMAAGSLLQAIRSTKSTKVAVITVPETIIKRGSTGPARSPSPLQGEGRGRG